MCVAAAQLKSCKCSANTLLCMQELEPKAALQQIALPIDSDQRAAGIATLSQFVWTAERSKLGIERAAFMRAVRDNLTAAEQVRFNPQIKPLSFQHLPPKLVVFGCICAPL